MRNQAATALLLLTLSPVAASAQTTQPQPLLVPHSVLFDPLYKTLNLNQPKPPPPKTDAQPSYGFGIPVQPQNLPPDLTPSR